MITPASGFVTASGAVVIGLLAASVPYLASTKLKAILGYDDALDTFGVHGVGGTLGALLTGVFATKAVNDVWNGKPMGWADGNASQVLNQAIGCAIAAGIAVVGTYLILKVCDAITGVRADEAQEIEGLDLSMHGEEGYNFEA